jgi:hypothetical protein
MLINILVVAFTIICIFFFYLNETDIYFKQRNGCYTVINYHVKEANKQIFQSPNLKDFSTVE